jgi:hypothetical protein
MQYDISSSIEPHPNAFFSHAIICSFCRLHCTTVGNYFTILQADDQYYGDDGLPGMIEGETSGLAFSPDKRFMYVAFQKEGKLFEVRRADGLPFNGRRLDIRYHARRN